LGRVLFINAVDRFSSQENRYQNIGIGYLIATLRKAFGTEFFKFDVISENVIDTLDKLKPEVVCITSVTQNYNIAGEYAGYSKEAGAIVIVGGIHITTLPHSLKSSMSIGCIGEGDETIVEVFNTIIENNWELPPVDILRTIKGIVFHNKNEIIITDPRNPIKELDTIPFPSRDFFSIDKSTYILTSRGCPYSCSFCASTVFWNRVRFFSAEYVVEEIKHIYEKYKCEWIHLYDDLFISNKKRMIQIIDLLGKMDLLGKIKFSTMGRANIINDDMALLMKQMNIRSVGLGLESGNNQILQFLKGKSVSVEKNRLAVEVLKRHKITNFSSFIIGSPLESRDQIRETYDFIKDSGIKFFDVNILTPFPGTEIWQYAINHGLVGLDMDWSLLSVDLKRQSQRAIILSELVSRKELLKYYRAFLRLRLFRRIRYASKHPFVNSLPEYIKQKIYAKIKKVVKPLISVVR